MRSSPCFASDTICLRRWIYRAKASRRLRELPRASNNTCRKPALQPRPTQTGPRERRRILTRGPRHLRRSNALSHRYPGARGRARRGSGYRFGETRRSVRRAPRAIQSARRSQDSAREPENHRRDRRSVTQVCREAGRARVRSAPAMVLNGHSNGVAHPVSSPLAGLVCGSHSRTPAL